MLNKKALSATAAAQALYVEDVFSTYLYTGNGSTQTITNNIDLSTEGGLVWIKGRDAALYNVLTDTARGVKKVLMSQATSAESGGSSSEGLTAFNNNGFSLTYGTGTGFGYDVNNNGNTFASWTFRKAEKFFDVVTYTGNGSNRTIAHNLGSVPGCIIVKRTDSAADWQVYHRSLANTEYLVLNSTAAKATGATRWNSTTPTSTVFSLGTDATVNANGGTYVAYVFAHDAGGFGESGSDNVITCGSFSTGTGNVTVNLGYEPQWIMYKRTNGAGNWVMFDTMRGWYADASPVGLIANDSFAEPVGSPSSFVTSTGFNVSGSASQDFVYIAIRRGPMKTPETGTEVFSPVLGNGSGTIPNFQSNFVTDAGWMKTKNNTSNIFAGSRLQGAVTLFTNLTDAEAASAGMTWDSNSGWGSFGRNSDNIGWSFRRAPGFMDVVCSTGSATGQTLLTHNLGVTPQMIIKKLRSSTSNWNTWHVGIPFGDIFDGPNTDGASYTNASLGNTTPPSSTQFQTYQLNGSSYVYYLFASVTGVSKVGSYTGNGSSQTINCGFTGGARFILIKRTDSTGDWVVFDSARGIVSGNDPYVRLNSSAAEVTDKDAVDTDSTGFIVNETTGPNINTNGGTYIYLAIA